MVRVFPDTHEPPPLLLLLEPQAEINIAAVPSRLAPTANRRTLKIPSSERMLTHSSPAPAADSIQWGSAGASTVNRRSTFAATGHIGQQPSEHLRQQHDHQSHQKGVERLLAD